MREDSPKVSERDENTPQIGEYIFILFVPIRDTYSVRFGSSRINFVVT
jgi:hypothetical protein